MIATAAALAAISAPLYAQAQVQTNLWKLSSLYLNPVLSTWGVQIPSLATPAGTFLAADPAGRIIATTSPSGGATFGYDWTQATTYSTTTNATTTPIWFRNNIFASSTNSTIGSVFSGGLQADNSTTTYATTTSKMYIAAPETTSFSGYPLWLANSRGEAFQVDVRQNQAGINLTVPNSDSNGTVNFTMTKPAGIGSENINWVNGSQSVQMGYNSAGKFALQSGNSSDVTFSGGNNSNYTLSVAASGNVHINSGGTPADDIVIGGSSDNKHQASVGFGTTSSAIAVNSPAWAYDFEVGDAALFPKTQNWNLTQMDDNATSTTNAIEKVALSLSSHGTWSGANATNTVLKITAATGGTTNYGITEVAGLNNGFGTFAPATTVDVNGDITDESQKNCSTLSSNSTGKILCTSTLATSTASYRNQSATISSVNTYTPTASSTYAINVSASIKTISAGTLTITCTYTNTDGVASTATFFPMGLTTGGLSSTGSPAFSPLVITPMVGTAMTVVASFTGVSIAYDIDASIIPLGSVVN